MIQRKQSVQWTRTSSYTAQQQATRIFAYWVGACQHALHLPSWRIPKHYRFLWPSFSSNRL